ncbi:hypothetical protein [Microvirga calopogonii]|uniref:hypothetical protein n=1 Tax=Microvirga calopogonii TaxID=2078013 RepID=UPI0013B472D1|nr:hypothetical protein [Microvirga calopogonii]
MSSQTTSSPALAGAIAEIRASAEAERRVDQRIATATSRLPPPPAVAYRGRALRPDRNRRS